MIMDSLSGGYRRGHIGRKKALKSPKEPSDLRNPPVFSQWFSVHKASVMVATMKLSHEESISISTSRFQNRARPPPPGL
ncbi:unnamed protein product [Microthlaspi erraticum]|uniref:Uncharacterized protein n=1 Tax=Microthlaspi erraticum TaxID=1685480 RepID=A0A6D2L0S6_9BRAS|nr:unnamed protein product [Microthlaspi erraticum]